MSNIVFLLLMFLTVLAAVILSALGIGGVLHWVLPQIELGMAVLIGTAMSGTAAYLILQLTRTVNEFQTSRWFLDLDDEDEGNKPREPRKQRRHRAGR